MAHITRGELRDQIRERLIDNFWSDAELNLYIDEALRVWNSLTGYWRKRVLVDFPVSDTDYISTEIISPDTFAVLRIDRYDEDPRIERACSPFANSTEAVGWAHNSRIGPFYGSAPENVVIIGLDANRTKLRAMFSDDYGESWAAVDDTYPVQATVFGSFDCHQIGNNIHVATQLTHTGSGKVAYSRFNMITREWDLQDVTVTASNTLEGFGHENTCVSITQRANGNIVIFYDKGPETVSATLYARGAYKESTDSGVTWGSAVNIGHTGQAINDVVGRVIADDVGRLHFFFGNTNSPFFGHLYVQSVLVNNSLTSVSQWFEGGALSQVQTGRYVGDYATWSEGGIFKMGIPLRLLENAYFAVFHSSDSMTAPQTFGAVGSASTFLGTSGGMYPQLVARWLNGTIYLMGNSFSNSVPTWLWVKSTTTPYTTWAPSGFNHNQAGPVFDMAIPGQDFAGNFIMLNNEPYYAMYLNSGNAGLGHIYNIEPISALPTSDAYTLSAWTVDCS